MNLTIAVLVLLTVLPIHAADGLDDGRASANLWLLDDEPAPTGGKSPKLAFTMSLIVPGLGELYAGEPKRAAVFLGIEAFTWFNYLRWRNRGNDLKAEFRAFADRNWDENRYREWQEYNRARGSPYIETETLPCKRAGEGCHRVDIQQYYEMIGKYDQFVFGWRDVRDVGFRTGNGDVDSNQRVDYEDQRNESNRFLKRASVIIGLTVVNRIASSIHAALRVRSAQLSISPRPDLPGLAVHVRF
ncbi:MAG: hypothetical protein OXU79_00345 [Gemmatimonadota bacterium]|nr:hypothetical protein [Gemmatimonadota bacterium]